MVKINIEFNLNKLPLLFISHKKYNIIDYSEPMEFWHLDNLIRTYIYDFTGTFENYKNDSVEFTLEEEEITIKFIKKITRAEFIAKYVNTYCIDVIELVKFLTRLSGSKLTVNDNIVNFKFEWCISKIGVKLHTRTYSTFDHTTFKQLRRNMQELIYILKAYGLKTYKIKII